MANESNENALLRRIADAFPQIGWQKVDFITEGWDHEVIILDDRLVFRFPLEEDYSRSLSSEIAFLEQFQKRTAVRIPQYRYVAPDKSFAGYDIVEGEVLEPGVLGALTPRSRGEVVQQLASFLTAIHGAPAPPKLPPFYVVEERDEIWEVLNGRVRSHLTTNEYRFAASILEEVDALLTEVRRDTVVHGDVYHRHLLWNKADSRLGIIDFSDMSFGDPALDFAELHEYGHDFVSAVYERYEGAKDASFLARAWTYQKWMAVYMLTDHFLIGKTTFSEARQTFDRVWLECRGRGT